MLCLTSHPLCLMPRSSHGCSRGPSPPDGTGTLGLPTQAALMHLPGMPAGTCSSLAESQDEFFFTYCCSVTVVPPFSPLLTLPHCPHSRSQSPRLSMPTSPLFVLICLPLPFLSPIIPLPSPLWPLPACPLFPSLWFYFAQWEFIGNLTPLDHHVAIQAEFIHDHLETIIPLSLTTLVQGYWYSYKLFIDFILLSWLTNGILYKHPLAQRPYQVHPWFFNFTSHFLYLQLKYLSH